MQLLKKTSLNAIKNFFPAFSIQGSNFSIRTLQLLEFEKVVKVWAKNEGWNPGIYEYVPFYKASESGHKGLFLNNQLIASLSSVRYSKDFAFLGIYIVDPSHRKKGVGEKLAKTVLSELENFSLLGLNGVTQQVENYQRKRFIPHSNNFRLSGPLTFQPCRSLKREEKIKIIGRENLAINQLIDFDANVFLFTRESFLRNWLKMPESYPLAAVNEKNEICGYGVVSKCIRGYKIAPLFAKNENIAKALYGGFYSRFKGKLMQVDIPEPNQSAMKLAMQFGLYKTLETKRMYKGANTKLVDELNSKVVQVYSLTSLEIG